MKRRTQIGALALVAVIIGFTGQAPAATDAALGGEAAIAASKTTLALEQLADQLLMIAASGGLIGLGLGAVFAAIGTFLHTRRKLRERLQS